MKKIGFLLFLGCFCVTLNAQQLLIESGNDSIDIPCHKAISLIEKDISKNFGNAIHLVEITSEQALANKDGRGYIISQFAKATILTKAASYKAAEESIQKAIDVANRMADSKEKNNLLAYCCHYMAYIFQSQSDWQNSLNNYYKSIEFARKSNDLVEEINLLIRIGDIFQAMGNTKASEKYFIEALQKSENTSMPLIQIQALTAYAYYCINEQANNAITYGNKALKVASESKLNEKNYQIYFTLAGAYFMQQNYPKAFDFLNLAINNAKEQNKPLSQYYIAFAEIYKTIGQNDLSEDYYKKAIAETQKENDLYMEYQASSMLVNFYKAIKDIDKLPDAMEKSYLLKDSIYITRQSVATQEMDYRYQTEKKEAAIAALSKSNKLKTGLVIVVSIAFIALVFLFITRKKQSKLKEKYYQTREKMLNQKALIATQQAQLEKEHKEKAILNELLKQEENASLQREMDAIQRELASTAIYIQEKNNILEQLNSQINTLRKKQTSCEELEDISRNIKAHLYFEQDWSKIKVHFDRVHPEFFNKLLEYCPSLTQNDLKNCAYLKMNLSNKEISNLTGIEGSSIKMAHYRLKKKLNLDKDEKLSSFINAL